MVKEMISQASPISLGLLIICAAALTSGAWSLAGLHNDVEGLKRIASAQMGSRWRCDPHMKAWVTQTEKLNPDWMPAPVLCEDDRELLNFRNLWGS